MTQPKTNSLIEDIIALSPTQEGILYHCLKDPELPLYISQVMLQVEGTVGKERLEQALEIVSQENECLRSVFRWEKINQPVQIVMKKMIVKIEEEDISALSAAEKEHQIEIIKSREQKKGFHLTKGPLLRVVLCREDVEKYRILLQFHHIILDGWSLGLLLSEWFQAYDQITKNEKVKKQNKPKYKSYIKWLQKYNHQQAGEFWKQELNSLSTHTKLPTRSQSKQLNKNVEHESLSMEEIMPKIEAFSKAYGVTVNAVINAAWGLMLQRYNNNDEAIFGLTVSGRPEELIGVEQMVGLFINTVPVIVKSEGNLTAVNYVRNVHQQLIRLKEVEHLPLSDIQSVVQRSGTEPLFNHFLVFENYPLDQQLSKGNYTGFTITGYEEAEVNHYELTVSFLLAGKPEIKLDYQADLFDRQTVQKMAKHFFVVLDQIITRPDEELSFIELVTGDERYQLLQKFNQTETFYHNQEKTVYELFVQQAQATAELPAVVYKDDQIIYRELAAKAEQLASHLQQQGEGEGSIVAILMDWSTDMITAIMGVLGSGSAYLPIDPHYPEERIRFIINNSQVKTIVTSEQYLEMAGSMAASTVILNHGNCQTFNHDTRSTQKDSDRKFVDFSLAYVIYTSGSTGRPKGVMIDQQAFTEFVLWAVEEYEHKVGYQVLLSNSYAFDSSVQQIFPPLVSGGTLHLLNPNVRRDAKKYLQYLKQHKINNLDEIPVVMNVLVEQAEEENEIPVLPHLTSLSLGSEYVPISLVRKCKKLLNSNGKIINGYGPAETTVETCTYHFEGDDDNEISLVGKPRSNLTVYILDKDHRLCPIGVPGEICVSGIGLSKGYLNQSELTDERFIPNPFSDVPGVKMYKTGDAGQWLPDGNVQYIGRIDHQIKIRGYRVEPGEIEDALLQHPLILDAVVVVQGKKQNHPVLCAFLKSHKKPEIRELRTFLGSNLPDYMIPAFYHYVEEYPKTPNGKINRQALEQFEIEQDQGNQDNSLPRHELDSKLVEIWKSILNQPSIGIHSNFFELGGNSIQLMRIYSKIKKEMPDISLEISDFFTYHTIAELSDYLAEPTKNSGTESLDFVKDQQNNEMNNKDIAIIGIGIRLPGITGPDSFWELLKEGRETIKEIPQSRKKLDPTGYKGKNYLRYGYLEGIDEFDPQFFDISPKIAKYMEPNQRIMLETTYHTLEDAGYTREQVKNRSVGVFMGAVLPTYHQYLDVKIDELFASNLPANLAGRLSYHFGFNGPSLVIDTACSSSLVALHTAIQSLRNKECEMAMVGGIHLDISPVNREEAMESSIVSPTESCKPFSDEADGTIGGEGCICVLLKPVEQALHDHDRIYSVIKGSAVVQDGARSNGITSPSPDAQAETMLHAWKDAGIDPSTISYIEAHGTGTKLGDPIEIKGIQKAYQSYTDQNQFIGLGSVKSNIGHLDSAAGLAGLAKTALSLKHNLIPATLHASSLNSFIHFEQSPVFVNSELRPLKSQSTHPARAGVSSFGLSGTNVHVVLEKFETTSSETVEVKTDHDKGPYLITVSESSERLLTKKIDDLHTYLEERNDLLLQDLSYSLNCRRSQHRYRFSTIVQNVSELSNKLVMMTNADIYETKQPKPVTVLLQDYEEGSEKLFAELCQSGLLSSEEVEEFNKYIANYSDQDYLQRIVSYLTFLICITKLLSRIGLNFSVTGLGVGAAAADILDGSTTFADIVKNINKYEIDALIRHEIKKEDTILSVGLRPSEELYLDEQNEGKIDVFPLEKGKASFLTTLSHLYQTGHNLSFEAIQSGNVISLPVYPFERKSYWFDMSQVRNKNKNMTHVLKNETKEEEPLLHQLVWTPVELIKEKKRKIDGSILIAGHNDVLQNRLAERLRNDGLTVVKINYGTRFNQLNEEDFEINILNPLDLENVLNVLEKDGHKIGAYVRLPDHNLIVNSQDPIYRLPGQFASIVDKHVQPVSDLGKQLGSRSKEKPIFMFQLTLNTDKIVPGDTPVNPLQSFTVSLNRNLNQEYEQLNSYCIDFSENEQTQEMIADCMYEEVIWEQELKESAYRSGIRYVKQLQRQKITVPPREFFRNDGIYLVTGGTGGIGMEICHSIATNIHATLLILGRTEHEKLNQSQLDSLNQLSDMGAKVEYYPTDIADYESLRLVIEKIKSTYGRVDGVIHTAGLKGKRISLQDATLDDFHEVYDAKVYGTVFLDLLLSDQMLDFFFLFSSVDAVLPEANQSPYSSANYFMDQYALKQRQYGRNFISIQWGGWQLTGMGKAATEDNDQSMIHNIKRLSPLILGFDPQIGVAAFHKLLRTKSSHTLVTGLNSKDLEEVKNIAFFELSKELQDDMQQPVEQTSTSESIEEIRSFVAATWTNVLELEEEPDIHENYFSFGGDSIQGIDIAYELSQKYQLQLDANILFQHDTIDSLSLFVHSQLNVPKSKEKISSIPKATPL
ncbi:amino acid adenylation domain-containing protein [Metabacillus halosaccharovorans]|uniref:amino acid adenylation domain-containing protein n=1 Tax=Metabacillus halosaccharovorans TaxID=930124 RepID=UPI0034CE98BB